MQIDRELVKNISLLSDLTDVEFVEIMEMSDLLKIHTGDTLFKQNEQSNAFYIILEGELEVLKNSKNGKLKRLIELEHENIVGEMGFMSETRRTATVKALTDVTLIRINKKPFKDSMRKSKSLVAYKVVHHLSKILSCKLRDLVIRFQEVYEEKSRKKEQEGFFPSLRRAFLK